MGVGASKGTASSDERALLGQLERGRTPWVRDKDHRVCMMCAKPFRWWYRRRHHCRKCGGVFCSDCCPIVNESAVVGSLEPDLERVLPLRAIPAYVGGGGGNSHHHQQQQQQKDHRQRIMRLHGRTTSSDDATAASHAAKTTAANTERGGTSSRAARRGGASTTRSSSVGGGSNSSSTARISPSQRQGGHHSSRSATAHHRTSSSGSAPGSTSARTAEFGRSTTKSGPASASPAASSAVLPPLAPHSSSTGPFDPAVVETSPTAAAAVDQHHRHQHGTPSAASSPHSRPFTASWPSLAPFPPAAGDEEGSEPLLLQQRRQPEAFRLTRVCRRCQCPLLATLTNELLTYILRFLRYDHQDVAMRTCTRFLLAVHLPYPFVDDLGQTFQWRSPEDIVFVSHTNVVLRAQDIATGARHTLTLTSKRALLSRRLWRRWQRAVDIHYAAQHRAVPCVHSVLQTKELVCVVSDYIDPHQTTTLHHLLTVLLNGHPASVEHSTSAVCSVDQTVIPCADDTSVGVGGAGRGGVRDALFEVECVRHVAQLPRVVANLLHAVDYLHTNLAVAHRNLSARCIHVHIGPPRLGREAALARADGTYELTLTSLEHAIVLGDGELPERASYLDHLRAQQHGKFKRQQGHHPHLQQQQPQHSASRYSREDAEHDRNTAAHPDVAETASAVSKPAPAHKRRPPPLNIAVDRALQRMSERYKKAAEMRKSLLQVDAERRASFSQLDAVAVPVMTTSGMLISSAILKSGSFRLGVKAQQEQQRQVVDDGIMGFVTPRGARGYTCATVAAAQRATDVLPSLSFSGREVKGWDLYSVGVISAVSLCTYALYFLPHGADYAELRSACQRMRHLADHFLTATAVASAFMQDDGDYSTFDTSESTPEAMYTSLLEAVLQCHDACLAALRILAARSSISDAEAQTNHCRLLHGIELWVTLTLTLLHEESQGTITSDEARRIADDIVASLILGEGRPTADAIGAPQSPPPVKRHSQASVQRRPQ